MSHDGEVTRGLDYGCGVGSGVFLMDDFGIEGYGLDISEVAVAAAWVRAKEKGWEFADKFQVVDGEQIPFSDGFFEIVTSYAVLDSMPYEIAKKVILEIDRVVSRLVFLSLISGDDSRFEHKFVGEEVVSTIHEAGTIQCYYDMGKIKDLIAGTSLGIKWCAEQRVLDSLSGEWDSRFFVVLEKEVTVLEKGGG
jgi:ubiquinone/menaquinone biosynthesis C-methylase UbiE